MRRTSHLLVISLVAFVAACGAEEPVDTSSTTTADSTTTTGADPTTTTSATEATTTSTEPTTPTTLAGEPSEIGPAAGTDLAVIGVAFDDVLNLRVAPGPSQPIVDELDPTEEELIALGETRTLPAFWTKVDVGNTTGWVHMGYVGVLGETTDVTSFIEDRADGRLEAETMTELGMLVADVVAAGSTEASTIVAVVDETMGDLGEVTYDVVGLGDDSVRAVRLHVFGQPVDGGFSLRTVEQTAICDPARGVDDTGVCV